MTTWFTADTHFHHRGILWRRPWAGASVESMNEALIARWNERVRPEDNVYHLGDVSFAGLTRTVAVLGQLNGRIRIVPGNHDDKSMLRRLAEMKLIEVLPPIYDLKLVGTAEDPGGRLTLCHFPLLSWNRMHHGALHLHGHCHGNLSDDGRSKRLDVGVDVGHEGFGAPVSFNYVVATLQARDGLYLDHHRPGAGEDESSTHNPALVA